MKVSQIESADRQRGTLFGLAVADVLGAAVEFEMPESSPEATGYNSSKQEDSMNQELVERLRDLAEEIEQAESGILFVSTDEKELVEAAKAMVEGGMVSYKVIGTIMYYIADMAEE